MQHPCPLTALPSLSRDTVPHTHVGSYGTPQTYCSGPRGASGSLFTVPPACLPNAPAAPCLWGPSSRLVPASMYSWVPHLLVPTYLSIHAIGSLAPCYGVLASPPDPSTHAMGFQSHSQTPASTLQGLQPFSWIPTAHTIGTSSPWLDPIATP